MGMDFQRVFRRCSYRACC